MSAGGVSGVRVRRAVELELTELNPTDLPGERFRQLGYEFDTPRVRVRGKALADEALDFVR